MRKVLIVDDSPTIRRMVAASLQTLDDVCFEEASNGLEGIEMLARERVSLMILDLNMPDMPAWKFCNLSAVSTQLLIPPRIHTPFRITLPVTGKVWEKASRFWPGFGLFRCPSGS